MCRPARAPGRRSEGRPPRPRVRHWHRCPGRRVHRSKPRPVQLARSPPRRDRERALPTMAWVIGGKPRSSCSSSACTSRISHVPPKCSRGLAGAVRAPTPSVTTSMSAVEARRSLVTPSVHQGSRDRFGQPSVAKRKCEQRRLPDEPLLFCPRHIRDVYGFTVLAEVRRDRVGRAGRPAPSRAG